MRISVVFSGNLISPHYGCSEGIKIYNIDEFGNITKFKTIMNAGIKGREIASLLSYYNVETVIVDGIGENAKQNLQKYNIRVIEGISGNILQAIEKLISNY